MRRFLVERDAIRGSRAVLTGAPFHHAARVVRLRPGDLIGLFDGSGGEWIAQVASVGRDRLEAEILRRAGAVEPPISITLLQAVLKGERMDWLVQKCGELGVARLVPMLTERVVARVPEDRRPARRTRWQKIADAAAEQCGRSTPLRVEEIAALADAAPEAGAADLAVVPHEGARERGLRDVLSGASSVASVVVVVGPEGGFTGAEVETLSAAGGVCVSLGPRILRAETAAIFAASVVLYALGDAGSASTVR